ncbi:hypothetical protein ABMA77_08110 [Halobacteriovorax sp. RZ-1]|uniref:hypothetical protein n=1 Tax=unclassified Halobacteriovorax TaxID=2639665 RepID=UPI003714F74B
MKQMVLLSLISIQSFAQLSTIRPDNSVVIEDYCICKEQKDIRASAGESCTQVCQNTSFDLTTMIAKTSVGEDISTNPDLRDLNGWCSHDLDNGALNPASCTLVVTDEAGDQYRLLPKTYNGTNSFEVILNDLATSKGSEYSFYLEESGSGVEFARSKEGYISF